MRAGGLCSQRLPEKSVRLGSYVASGAEWAYTGTSNETWAIGWSKELHKSGAYSPYYHGSSLSGRQPTDYTRETSYTGAGSHVIGGATINLSESGTYKSNDSGSGTWNNADYQWTRSASSLRADGGRSFGFGESEGSGSGDGYAIALPNYLPPDVGMGNLSGPPTLTFDVGDWWTSYVLDLGEMQTEMWNAATDAFAWAGDAVTDAYAAAGDALEAWGGAMADVTGVQWIDDFTGFVSSGLRAYGEVVGGAISSLPALAGAAVDYVSNMTVDDMLDVAQLGLDVVGMIPVVGEVADLANDERRLRRSVLINQSTALENRRELGDTAVCGVNRRSEKCRMSGSELAGGLCLITDRTNKGVRYEWHGHKRWKPRCS
jgi:hypothetical protein